MAFLAALRIIFIIDGSGSISNDDYNKIINLYQPLINENENLQAFQFSDIITSIQYKQNRGTNTHIAFEHLAQIIEQSQESDYLGIFLSDGLKNQGPDENLLSQRFQKIHQSKKNIYLSSIAVGTYIDQIFFDKIKQIVPNQEIPNVQYLLKAQNQDQLEIHFLKIDKMIKGIQKNIILKQNDNNEILNILSDQLNQENKQLKYTNIEQQQKNKQLEVENSSLKKIIKQKDEDFQKYQENEINEQQNQINLKKSRLNELKHSNIKDL